MIDDAIPAASLILIRDRVGAPPDLLMVRRGAALAFAGDAYVFPGGRVDEADRQMAALAAASYEPDDGAARIAAVRETIEETGVWWGVSPPPADPAAHRAGGLAGWIAATAARFEGDRLVPFARWCPPMEVRRRFDTRFYIADAAMLGEHTLAPDGAETAEAFWVSAAAILARTGAGDGHVIFPTRRLLERLARFASFAEARADAERHPPRIISPWVEERADGRWMCIPADAGYPVCEEAWGTAQRG